MPKPSKVKKLQAGDPGFNPAKASFEVEMEPRKKTMTLEEVDARIAQAQASKADAVAQWDARIADLEDLKSMMNSA